MKSTGDLVNANGKLGKVFVVLKGGEKVLKEYTKDEEARSGSTYECYVLTAPGDIISVDITADANTADVFDLEVDGILRASVSSKALAKVFHGTISKVCYKGKSGNKRDSAKYCAMKVKRRDESMGKSSCIPSLSVLTSELILFRCHIQTRWDSISGQQSRNQSMAKGPKRRCPIVCD
jgi:hypothetical protein